KALVDLFDPEAENAKRQRVRAAIAESKTEVLSSGLAMDRIESKTRLPVQLIEDEMRTYAAENPGLVAKRLEGRVVLFRQGTAPVANGPAAGAPAGGSVMPLMNRIKTLFSRK